MDALVGDPHQDHPVEAARADWLNDRRGVEQPEDDLLHLLPVLLDAAQVVQVTSPLTVANLLRESLLQNQFICL